MTNKFSDTQNTMPKSIGIIMDGNRRFAKQRDMLTIEGHRRGAEKLKEVLQWTEDQGIQFVTVYAFSTENWNRNEKEVAGLIQLFEEYLSNDVRELAKRAHVRFIGDRDRFSPRMRELMNDVTSSSQGNKSVLAIALSYGGRSEILRATNKLIKMGVTEIDEEALSAHLDTEGIPDPELILRTGGEQRLSNFLPWQSIYSELIFTETLWPALTREEFDRHIDSFRARKRNFGI
jgi:undecaprenyl diphosphate synthase